MAGERREGEERRAQVAPAWMGHCPELLDGLPIGLLILDGTGRVVYANSASTRMSGTPKSVLTGRRYDDPLVLGGMQIVERTAEDGAQPVEHAGSHPIERAFRSGEPVLAFHLTVDRPATGRRYLSFDAIPLHADLGGIAGVAVVIADETEEIAVRSETEWLHTDLLESRRVVEELLRLSDSLNAINDTIHSTLDFDDVLLRVVKEAADALGAESALVEMRDDRSWVPRVVSGLPHDIVGRPIPAEESAHAAAVLETRAALIAEVATDAIFANDFLRSAGACSLLSVPLLARGEIVGVLSFFTTHDWRFTNDQMSFASKVAAAVALAMENARVYAEERHIADTLQRALLAVPASVPGVDFEHVYQSATEAAWVGGDFFDIFELSERRVGIVIGDVSGKGVEASVLASFTRQLLKAHTSGPGSLAAAVQSTNELVWKVSQSEDFVTVFLGILSLDDDTLTFCSAGHPPPVLRHEGQSRVLYDGGPILGAFEGVDYHEQTVPMVPGDLIVLYTDGVIEAKRDGELFGEARLVELIDAIDKSTRRDLPGILVERVTEFAKGRLRDDVAVLAVQRTPD